MDSFSGNEWLLAGFVGLALVWYLVKGYLSKRQVRKALSDGALVIDVRSAGEFAGGHFGGAMNIPHDRIGSSLKKIGAKDRNIVVYCASGSRSSVAARILRSNGYRKVTNAGGIASMPSV